MSFPSASRAAMGLALTGLLVTGAAACGSSDGVRSSSGSDTIHAWVLQNESMNTVQKTAATEFNKTSDVKVTIDVINPDNYRDKLRASMGSDNAPDILFNWGGGSIRPYVDAGQMVDLTPTFTQDQQFKDAFLPAVLDRGKINDKYYGVPLRGMQPVLLFYNKNMFSRIKAQPPTTFSELLTLVDKFKAAKITPFSLAGKQNWTELMWVEYLVDRYGGAEVFDNIVNGVPDAWQNPAVLQAMTAVRQLVDRGAFGTNFASVDYNQGGASTLFAKGKSAMHLMGSWEYTNQVQDEPTFAKSGLGWTTFPTVEGGKGDPSSVVGNPTNYFSVTTKSKHQDAAIAFLKLMSSDSYVSGLLKAGDVPVTTSAANKLTESTSPEFATYQYQLVQKASNFTLSWDQAMSPEGGQAVNTAIQKVFNKQLSPQQFIDTVKATK